MEAGVLIDLAGSPLYWHLPLGRTGVSLPDSKELWEVIWENRDRISGFAHSHPGAGPPWPSTEDLTTFSAVERALGRRLEWWIVSSDYLALLTWQGPGLYDYGIQHNSGEGFVFEWLDKLREYSYNTQS